MRGMIPDDLDLDADKTLSAATGLPGPDAMYKLARECGVDIKDYLERHAGIDRKTLDHHMFEALIVPYLLDARRIGDDRGEYRATHSWTALYPNTK